MLTVSRIFLYFQVPALALLGLFFWVQPAVVSEMLGVSALNAMGSNELRGFFGGGFLALAGLILWGLRSPSAQALGGLISVASVMGMIVVGRLIGFGVDGLIPLSIAAAVIELLIGLACMVLVREHKPTATR